MTTAEKVLAAARRELGTKESPANSNRVKYNTWYYGRVVAYIMAEGKVDAESVKYAVESVQDAVGAVDDD